MADAINKNDVETKEAKWFMIPLYIMKNFINGVSFVFYRFPKKVIGNINEKRVESLSQKEGRSTKGKKIKIYKYSEKKLAKLAAEKEQLLKELAESNGEKSEQPVTYVYKVKTPEGRIISDTINGYSKADINAFLINEGYEVYSIKTSDTIKFLHGGSLLNSKLSTKDLIFWITQLSTYLKAGITLSESVRILSKQMGKKSKIKQKALQSVSYELSIGQPFSNALEKQGNMFPGLFINMMRAAEATGSLIETLDEMADYYTETDKTRKQMISAMTYPGIITVFAFGVITFIIVWVIPQFVDIYAASQIALPKLTQVIINISNMLTKHGLLVGTILIGILLLLYLAYKYIKGFRMSIQSLLMRLPIVGKIIIYNEITIFTKTFSSLLKNNVFITNSMEILSKITNNEIYKAIMLDTINNIVKGNKISESFKDHWAVPDVAYYMIVTGESTGELPEMMQKVSGFYQEQHRNIVNNLKAFIEPLMIAFLAIVVGGIILAVIIPMFGMYSAL